MSVLLTQKCSEYAVTSILVSITPTEQIRFGVDGIPSNDVMCNLQLTLSRI